MGISNYFCLLYTSYINISERMIYPGLDGICRWIARRYAPLGPRYNAEHAKEEQP